ncbi:PP2C family protein-serine/threonine phosphatase [Methylovulum psychrotolerans]|uniref:Histidine kinase n=1 Tax=Methylovulum psychrotolerans TaxID=1704499 RepID=A0A2S5CH93_9GAMM|nr:GAF domain-containing SpoIIE family protein phosphatase [Methylovulum psychrotolerans]MBT9099770.1 SpoIIE family protein phosphatase [Methylovulum psychrotolerans]POZ50190.1 histidine kinase [Methylovulum psychrotolerans]
MNPEIKLKRLCQKGHAAKLIQHFLADRKQPLTILDLNGDCLLGDSNTGERHAITVEGNPLGWVCGSSEDAALLAAFVSYMAQKELESKLLAQETLSKYKELTLLYELGEKIAACLDIDELAHLTLAEARRFLPDGQDIHLGILLEGTEAGQLTVCAGQGELFPTGAKLLGIDGITQQVLASGNTEIVNEVWQDPRYQACAGVLSDISAMLCAPLKTRDKTFGVLSVISREAVSFSAAEAKVLNLLATQVALAIARVHLIHERVAQERLQESLKLSHSIQMGMLSTAFPRFSDGQPIDLFAFMEPAREVSGDFYDFFHLDNKTLLLVIGDVSDKGVPAALFMVMVKTLIRAIAKQYTQPHQILAALNPELCRDNEASMFVTLFLATLDLDTYSLNYSFGGHNPPLHLSRYGIVTMLTGDSGTALGIIDGISFSSQTLQLSLGDSLLLYTDGISEAMDKDYNAYGEIRLCGLLTGLAYSNAQELIGTIMTDVIAFTAGAEQSDDITLMALQIGRP